MLNAPIPLHIGQSELRSVRFAANQHLLSRRESGLLKRLTRTPPFKADLSGGFALTYWIVLQDGRTTAASGGVAL